MRLLRLESEILVNDGEYFVRVTWETGEGVEVFSCATIGFSILDMIDDDGFGGPISDDVHDMILLLEPNIFGGLLEDYIPF